MQDQVSALLQLGIRAAYLNSTLPAQSVRETEQGLLNNDMDLLYIAPERLLQERTLALLERTKLALFAIDEAHCVSQWGHDFRKDYLGLDQLHQRFPSVPRIAPDRDGGRTDPLRDTGTPGPGAGKSIYQRL